MIPGLGRSPGGQRDNPLLYSCLENSHGQRSLAGYGPWGCTESDMTEDVHGERAQLTEQDGSICLNEQQLGAAVVGDSAGSRRAVDMVHARITTKVLSA